MNSYSLLVLVIVALGTLLFRTLGLQWFWAFFTMVFASVMVVGILVLLMLVRSPSPLIF